MRNGGLDLLLLMMTMLNRISPIQRLFSKRNPSAIFRAIVAIYIYSFNRQMLLIIRCFNPIGKINIIIPFITYLYTSTAVVFKVIVFWILASLSHTLPYLVSSGKRFIMFCKSFSTPTRPTIKALITLISSALKNLLASFTSKVKIGSVFIAVHGSIIQRLG